MQKQQADIQRLEQQLSSGLKFLQPSDDPVGAARILNLQENIEVIDQFSRNGSVATSQLEVADTAYSNITNTLQRIRELTVQGANSTNAAEDRSAIATEIIKRLEELVALANTQDGNGEYIFSGSRVHDKPFAITGPSVSYSGDKLGRSLPVGESTQVQVRDSGEGVFLNIGGSSSTMFEGIQNIIVALLTPQTDAASIAAFNTSMETGLNDLDASLEQTSRMRVQIGTRLSAIDQQQEINADFKLQLQTVVSDTRDLDYAEAISQFNLQLTSLQAAQQTYVRVQGLSLFNFL